MITGKSGSLSLSKELIQEFLILTILSHFPWMSNAQSSILVLDVHKNLARLEAEMAVDDDKAKVVLHSVLPENAPNLAEDFGHIQHLQFGDLLGVMGNSVEGDVVGVLAADLTHFAVSQGVSTGSGQWIFRGFFQGK